MLAAAAPDRLAVDVADAQALKAKAGAGDRSALEAAARQFESLMIAQMLKAMRETRFSDEDDPLSGGESMKLYRDLLDQQWASKMASGRGLGFADMLVKHLERQAGYSPETSNAAPAAGKAPEPVTVPNQTGPAVDAGGSAGVQAPVTENRAPSAAPAQGGTSPAGTRKQRFLETLRTHAESAEAATGVPARFILAQAALESGWGEREIRAADGQGSYNLFGIKAGREWAGEAVEATTTEYRGGLASKLSQRFRAYADYGEAFTDYAALLKRRYGQAVAAGDDAEAFAKALAEGGYATDPAYAGKLRAVIASVASAGR